MSTEDQNRIAELNREVRGLVDTVSDLRATVAVLKVKNEDIKQIAGDVRQLQEARQQSIGERTIISIICIFVGGILQAVVTFLLAKPK